MQIEQGGSEETSFACCMAMHGDKGRFTIQPELDLELEWIY